jgi:hypothetical protein
VFPAEFVKISDCHRFAARITKSFPDLRSGFAGRNRSSGNIEAEATIEAIGPVDPCLFGL